MSCIKNTLGLGGGKRRSLRTQGKLLQVMDAILVNQTHVEGGQVEDEALVQLQRRKEDGVKG